MAAGLFFITIDSTKVDSTLTNFPVMIYLSSSSGASAFDVTEIFDDLGANSKKIKIKNSSGTELYCEIEMWDDTAEKAVLHVKVDSISSSADTKLTIEWDSTWADNTTYIGETGDTAAESVWDSNFVAVYHMNQDPSGGAGCMLDSTSNSHDGTPQGTMTSGDLVDANYGKALDFDGSNDYIAVVDSANFDTGAEVTTECFFEPDSGNISVGLIMHDDSDYKYMLYLTASSGDCAHYVRTSSGVTAPGLSKDYTTQWNYAAGTYEQSLSTQRNKIFIDGVHEDSVDGANESILAGDEGLYLGRWGSNYYDGRISEMRLSSTARSAAWIKATNESMTDSLVSLDDVVVTTSAATSVADTTATLNGALDGLGGETSVDIYFEYGTTTAYGTSTTAQTLSATGSFSANLTGLTANTIYYFRAVVEYGTTPDYFYGEQKALFTGWIGEGLQDSFELGILTDTTVVSDKLSLLISGSIYPATGNRQMPHLITDTSADISWTATTPTSTTLTVEAQVQGTSAITDEAVGTGDGTTTVFTLDYWPANTPAVTVNAVAETGFTLGNDRRTITFTTAPADTHAILASYTAVDDPVVDVGEIQELDLDSPAGGTFKLGDGTIWTADIAYDATAATIETALEGLYGAGTVEVTKEILETYTAVGTTSWTVPAGINTVDVLVVAGGGAGGGTHYAGGGGGGGVVLAANISVTSGTSKTVTVGAGGAGVSNAQGGSGSNSVFDSFIALGSGGGGHFDGISGVNGGSGGGGGGTGASGEGSGGSATQTSPTGATGYGNNGGNGVVQRGGGGGGAGAVGSKGDGPGDGGAGIEIWGTYYAGGGGGGTYTQTPGSGGVGGGGAGTTRADNSPSAGTPNTGGGGGGASNATATGAAGGSGIVIIALPNFLITFAHSVGNSNLTADFTGLT